MTGLSKAVVVAGLMLLAACGSGDAADPAAEASEASIDGANPTTTARSVVTTAPTVAESPESAGDESSDGGIPDVVFGVDQAVRFDAGGTSAVLVDAVVRGERNRYTLGAAAGQTMNLTITSVEDNAVFEVYDPDEGVLLAETTSASFQLPSDGVYTIIVGGTRGNASYQLTVEIPAL